MRKIKFIFLYLLLISVLIFTTGSVLACPSASIIHNWGCVSDDECPSWMSCDLWEHVCKHKKGYCGMDMKCDNFWEGCDNITHKCTTLEGYCSNDTECKETQKCDTNTHKCKYKPGMCENNTECNPWQICVSGKCKPKEGFCDSHADCIVFEKCEEHSCVISETTWMAIIIFISAITSAVIYLKYDSGRVSK